MLAKEAGRKAEPEPEPGPEPEPEPEPAATGVVPLLLCVPLGVAGEVRGEKPPPLPPECGCE